MRVGSSRQRNCTVFLCLVSHLAYLYSFHAHAGGNTRPSALELAATCEGLLERGDLVAARQACLRAQRQSGEAWARPFLTEARILSQMARSENDAGASQLAVSASAQAVDSLRRAIAASPMDDLTDFRGVSALEFTGSTSVTETLRGLRFGDLPGLKRQPLHALESVAGAVELQAALPSIIAEFKQVAERVEAHQKKVKTKMMRNKKNKKTKKTKTKKTDIFGWRPAGAYSELHDAALLEAGGAWDNLGLFSYGVRQKQNCAELFPQLCGLIESLSRIRSAHIGHVVLSRVRVGSKIQAHEGAPNARVTIQCPLELPYYSASAGAGSGRSDSSSASNSVARLIVGNVTVDYKMGECFVFDDNIQHRVEVDHLDDGDDAALLWRTVLIAHAWHPEVRSNEMLASVALSANMDPGNRESVLKHVYAESAAEWRQEALRLREERARNDSCQATGTLTASGEPGDIS
jgi:hypothetical protein